MHCADYGERSKGRDGRCRSIPHDNRLRDPDMDAALVDSRSRGMAEPAPNMGLIARAMAWRVKYRKVDKAGQPIRMLLRVDSLGVHKNNRGGVFPAGLRCRSLCGDVLHAGFIKEDVNHAGVAVEEPPAEEFIRLRVHKGGVVESAAAYNIKQASKDELLGACFQAPFDTVQQTLLGHNHIMLVLRAFLGSAKWDIPADAEKGIACCDADGRLSITAVAEHANGKELAEVLTEGMRVEVLSWKMDVEEPEAATTISEALNLPHQEAMRTTELTAIAVLKGEIIAQQGGNLSQQIAYQTMRNRVRSQLHAAADDPDLPEVFDFLISNGVGTNTYIDDLQQWTQIFVDSKKRQMRFTAFAVVNKMCETAPLAKIAVLKRAWRKTPVNGFCPSPETAWGDWKWSDLRILEELLRFFHVSCKEAIAAMAVTAGVKFWGNVDIAAAEVFWNAKTNKMKYAAPKIQELMLEGTSKYFEHLKIDENSEGIKVSIPADWIKWKKPQSRAETPTTGTLQTAPKVVVFSEASGIMKKQQVSFSASSQQEPAPPQKLPWREWYKGIGANMGNTASDKSAAVAVLQSLHNLYPVDQEPVDVLQLAGRNFVIALTEVKAKTILLPPCVPKQSQVVECSEHPAAVPLTVHYLQGDREGTDEPQRTKKTFFVNPEFKSPQSSDNPAAVAEADGASQQEWVWGPPGMETMHPFWAVRRMNSKQLARESLDEKVSKVKPRFNCSMAAQSMSCVTVGVVKDNSLNITRCCEVQF